MSPHPSPQGTMKYPNGDTYEGQYAKLEVDDPAAVAAYEAEKAEKEAAAAEAEPPADGEDPAPAPEPEAPPEFPKITTSLRHGTGKYTFASGVVYEGDYVEGKKQGAGVMTFPDGGKYEGAFDKDCMAGEGVFNYPSGDVYSGAFAGNKKSGVGSYMFKASQSQFIGEWEDGEFKRGEWVLSNGTSWKGEFEGGKPVGEGVQTFGRTGNQQPATYEYADDGTMTALKFSGTIRAGA